MKERKALLMIIILCCSCMLVQAQVEKHDTVHKELKEAPEALKDFIKEFERRKEEAQKQQAIKIVDPPALEIDGIVMDETMSKAGRDFYEIFFSLWVKPSDFKNYYIKIKEKPFRMNSTLIEVHLKEVVVYRAMLQRRYDDIVEMARQANRYTLGHINKLKQDRQNLKHSYY